MSNIYEHPFESSKTKLSTIGYCINILEGIFLNSNLIGVSLNNSFAVSKELLMEPHNHLYCKMIGKP